MQAPSFGGWLKRLRTQQDLTQEALAERVGCSPQTVRMLESGRRRPSFEMAERLADVLAVSANDRPTFLRIARSKLLRNDIVALEQVAVVQLPTRPSLPAPPTPLIGRQHEQAEIALRLRDPNNRLLTIVGAGGAGKTRLAIQSASDLAHTFPDGAVFVSLAPVLHRDGIAPAISAALGHTLSGHEAPEEEILRILRDRKLLLVLDNLEHLLDATAFIIQILQQARDVRLLATSRARLRVQAEWVIPLGGLSLPDDCTHDNIIHSEAVLLFVERAQRMSGRFELTLQNEPLVAQICRRLDGLPLALELAAAQISLLSPAMLLQRIDDALPLLIDGARDLTPRQRTMRATIEWSYDLLTDDERALFARLALFSGSFSLDAAEAVCAGEPIPRQQVLPLLRRLIDQSLVVLGDIVPDNSAGAVRYRLLEPIRQFAFEQLMANDSESAVQERYAAFFLDLAEQAAPKLTSAEQIVWLDRLEQEHANFRVAIRWLIDQQDFECATRLCWALWIFHWMRGHLREGRRWVEQILAQTERSQPVIRGRALLSAMVIGFGQADYAWAATFIDECSAIYGTLNDPQNLAHTTSLSGLNLAGLQQYESAEPLMELGVRRYLEVGLLWNAAMLLTYWAAIPRNRGDYTHAKQLTEQALDLAQQQGDRITMYSSLFNLASIAQAQNAHLEAMNQFRSALALAVEVVDNGNIASCLDGIAAAAAAQGDSSYAAKLWGAAEALRERQEAAVYSYAPHQAQYAEAMEKAGRLLPDEDWQALWHEGRTLDFEQILHHALHIDPIHA